MTARPYASSFSDSSRSSEPDRPFTIEQFGDLVAAALDIQRIPDSVLAFSFGGNTYPPSVRSTRSGCSQGAHFNKLGPFTRLRGAFARKLESRNAPLGVPPETYRLVSPSAPSLSHPQLRTIPTSASLTSLNLDGSCLDSSSSPPTPADSASFPTISRAWSGSFGDFGNHACLKNSRSPDIPPDQRNHSSARSFLNLDPLTIPNSPRKSSRKLFSSGSLPTPPELSSISPSESNGMRSFFDDSGYVEDMCTRNVAKKSKASLRSLFTPTQADSNHPPASSCYENDKALPPSPTTGDWPAALHFETTAVKDVFYAHNNASFDRSSLFYTPSAAEQSFPDVCDTHSSIGQMGAKNRSEKELRARRVSNWIIRASNSTPRKTKLSVLNSLSPYPSPTLPLPPTPDLPSVGLPVISSASSGNVHVGNGLGETSEDSIDSMEILSWRMPNLEQQISKTSTSSSANAHALGRPSRGSIRERLGLGARLHVHVPLPAEFLSASKKRSISQDELSAASTIRDRSMHQSMLCPSSGSDFSKMPMQRLTSVSLVTLKSNATITTGSKGASDEEKCADRKDALAVDRAFTPEDDPFAADPLTPVTPITPVFETQTSKAAKYRSFMPLGNNSSLSISSPEVPISATASLLSCNYRLGSNPNKSSPVLTSSPSHHRPSSTPRSTRTRATLEGVRNEPPSLLVDTLGSWRRPPSIPSDPPSSRLNLGHAVANSRKARSLQQGHVKNKQSRSGGRNVSHIVGDTESRPHSPFPLLFRMSDSAKASSASTRESRRLSITSTLSDGTEERAVKQISADQPVKCPEAPLLVRHVQGRIKEPRAPSAKDVDAFGDAARNSMLEFPRGEIVSPTAWLLDSDDYDDVSRDVHQINVRNDKSIAFALDLSPRTGGHATVGGLRAVRAKKLDEVSPDPVVCGFQYASLPRTYCGTVGKIETEVNLTILKESQSWPLPPIRTVVVDEDNGDAYHVIEPDIEAGSVSHTPRHSIRYPEKQLGITAAENLNSLRSSNDSPTSQKLSSSQARLTADGICVLSNSPSSYKVLRSAASCQLRERSRSATSTASIGACSTKTSRTAFYSARSTLSHGSDKSTFSFVHSRQVGVISREGSLHSASSSRSPSSSADLGVKSPTAQLASNLNSGPHIAVKAKSPASSNRNDRTYACHETFAIPQHIVLRPTVPDDIFHVVVSGWSRLLSICAQHGRVTIESSENENEFGLLSVSVEEVRGSKFEDDDSQCRVERIGGIGSSERQSFSASACSPLIKLSLSLQLQQTSLPATRDSQIAFCLPLPTVLGEIVDILRQTQPSWTSC